MKYIQHNVFPDTNGIMNLLNQESLFDQAIYELKAGEQISTELSTAGLLGIGSTIFSSMFELAYPLGGIEPINTFTTAIADSGFKKTRSLAPFVKPIYDFQNDHLKIHEEQLKEYECELEVFNEKLKEIKKSKTDSESKKIELYLHRSTKPKPPIKWTIIFQDASPMGFMTSVKSIPSAAIITTEGRSFYNPRNQADMDKSCANWSGEPITITRKNEHHNITNIPFTYVIYIQPGAFEKFMVKKGDEFRDSGFAARTNFVYVNTPPLDNMPNTRPKNYVYIPKLQNLIRDALENMKEKFENGILTKTQLEFSASALNKWFELNQEIQSQMNLNNPYARFQGALDHAARIMQNISRTAAIIHCFNNTGKTISLESLEQAISIGAYFSDTYRWLFVKPPLAVQDAQVLDHWLNQFRSYNHRSFLRKNFLRQNGPNSLRKKDRLENALTILYQNGLVRAFADGKTTWLNLLPSQQQDILPADLSEKIKPIVNTI